MSEVTEILARVEAGDGAPSDELFAVVYDELRRMARAQMARERAGHTLEATALVHEAFLRLMGGAVTPWDGRGHFFASAAEAMRRILVDHARTKNAAKRGGGRGQVELDSGALETASLADGVVDLLALDEALTRLAEAAPEKAQIVKLRYFAGLTLEEAARAMGISEATAKRYWTFARAWLFRELEGSE